MRGEHASILSPFFAVIGSSPHAWGTHKGRMNTGLVGRFIPTCVGNTSFIGNLNISIAVHPHMRGEHFIYWEFEYLDSGSSPHAWGTPEEIKSRTERNRFIPTCVGNTGRWYPFGPAPAVHPHMRGEHDERTLTWGESTGSSPHAWGTPGIRPSNRMHRRFIPTCVGNTESYTLVCIYSSVHPHMRGEHGFNGRKSGRGCGSSPHAWGTPTRTSE